MNTRNTQDVLRILLAAGSRAGVTGVPAAPAPENTPYTIRPLAADTAVVEADGEPVCVILTPAAWQQLQATNAAWQRLFHWALQQIDTPTLRRMAATARTRLDRRLERSTPCR